MAVDAQRRADPEFDHETTQEKLRDDQLPAADLVVLNKTDFVENVRLAPIEQGIGTETAARLVTSQYVRLPAAVLLGLGAATKTVIGSRHELDHANECNDHQHYHDRDDLTSFVSTGPPLGDVSGGCNGPRGGDRRPRYPAPHKLLGRSGKTHAHVVPGSRGADRRCL